MKHDFITILADPVSGEKLLPENNNLINKATGKIYPIIDGIPMLLPENKENYIEHYHEDGEQFDYFQPQDAAAEADFERIREAVLSTLSAKGGFLLDVGSGGGWLANRLKSSTFTVCSIDLSMKNLIRIKKQTGVGNSCQILADALNPPFLPDSVDCIVASEVIEHVTEPALFVRKLSEILKPGGMLIVTTPYKEKLRYDLCIHCNKPTPRNAHIHSFDETKLQDYKGDSEFKYIKFGNKAMIFSRIYLLLKFVPYPVWRLLDSLFNVIFPKPAHILAIYKKKDLKI